MLTITKHLIRQTKMKTQPKQYCELLQEAGLEIKTLETVLRHQYNLRGLLSRGKGKLQTSYILYKRKIFRFTFLDIS